MKFYNLLSTDGTTVVAAFRRDEETTEEWVLDKSSGEWLPSDNFVADNIVGGNPLFVEVE